MKFTEQDRARLAVEIFEATGLAVDKDDPVIICALMQSHYMRQAQEAVSANISKSANEGLLAIENAINAKADRVAEEVSKRIATAIQSSAEAEASRLKGQLAKYAEGLKKRLAPLSYTPEESQEPSRKLYVAVASALAIVAFCGVVVGSTAFGQPQQFSAKQMEQMSVGILFLDILPTLDKQTREKLKRSLQERAKTAQSK